MGFTGPRKALSQTSDGRFRIWVVRGSPRTRLRMSDAAGEQACTWGPALRWAMSGPPDGGRRAAHRARFRQTAPRAAVKLAGGRYPAPSPRGNPGGGGRRETACNLSARMRGGTDGPLSPTTGIGPDVPPRRMKTKAAISFSRPRAPWRPGASARPYGRACE